MFRIFRKHEEREVEDILSQHRTRREIADAMIRESASEFLRGFLIGIMAVLAVQFLIVGIKFHWFGAFFSGIWWFAKTIGGFVVMVILIGALVIWLYYNWPDLSKPRKKSKKEVSAK